MWNFALLAMLLLVICIGLLPAGIALIVLSGRKRRDHPACGRCGYDLTGFAGTSDTCPECGGKHTEVGILPAETGRRTGQFRAGLVLVILALLIGATMATTALLVRQRAIVRAQQAQIQAQIAVLNRQMTVIATEAQALEGAIAAETDETAAAQLEETLAALEQKLEETESELAETKARQDVIGNR